MTLPVSPRATRLLRVPTPGAAQQTLAALVAPLDPALASDTVVVVPSASAAAQARRTIERLHAAGRVPAAVFAQIGAAQPPPRPALCLPAFLTRDGLYALLHARLAGAAPLVDDFVREAILRAAAEEASRAGAPPPFTLRPGILAEMLIFHDTLTRLRRTADDVERLLVTTLAAEAGTDRGAARLLEQTRFLVAAFRAFQRRAGQLDALDEHGLRTLALERGPAPALRHVIVTAADAAADPAGLWPADFDLLARLPGLARLDVIATDAMLSAGFDERLERRLPGIESLRVDTLAPPPILRVPQQAQGQRFFVSRDREEELHLLARELKLAAAGADRSLPGPVAPDAHAIVVQRPLPYLYLARHALDDAGVPWTASDALPLAAEPYAAAVDVVGECAIAECARPQLSALLRSPHLRFPVDDARQVNEDDVRRLDEALDRASYVGGLDRLREWLASRIAEREADGMGSGGDASRAEIRRLAAVAPGLLAVVDTLAPLTTRARLSALVSSFTAFLDRYETTPRAGDDDPERHRRARAAIRLALRRLREAAEAHHDPEVDIRQLMALLRRWIEARTFTPRVGEAGVHLLDADAARFADVAHVWVLGAVDGDWPAPGRRDIFYPPALLADLDWPRDTDRRAAARAQFTDLLGLARCSVTVSTFTLEDDAIVEASVLLEELDHAGLAVVQVSPPPAVRVDTGDALCHAPVAPEACAAGTREWLAGRQRRSEGPSSRLHGYVGALARDSHTVTQIDTWIECPFRYFARHVLDLEDEQEPDQGLPPRERGELVHAIFERFFRRWGASGRGAVTAGTLDAARALMRDVVEEALAGLDAADAALERTRLLGSAVSTGMGDLVLDLEVERGLPVIERRLEERFEGRFPIAGPDGAERPIALRGKADRIDLLEGGRIDLFDYKTGRAPDRSVQLPVYAHVAELRLAGHGGQHWTAGSADYVALRGRPLTHALGRRPEDRAERMRDAQASLVKAVDAIAAGEFPPRPLTRRTCSWCAYAVVCRKDYVDAADGDDDDQA